MALSISPWVVRFHSTRPFYNGDSMKKKLKIKEVDPTFGGDLELPSKIIMKSKGDGLNFHRKFTLKNNGGLWVHPYETKISFTMYDPSNTLGKPEITIKLQDGSKVSMSFLDLCYLRDILVHTSDLGLNLFNDTVVDDERSKIRPIGEYKREYLCGTEE